MRAIRSLVIPSRDNYILEGGERLPVLSTEEELEADVVAWRFPQLNIEQLPIYVRNVVVLQGSTPNLITTNELLGDMVQGTMLIFDSPDVREEFITTVYEHRRLLIGSSADWIEKPQVEQMLTHPISALADIEYAAGLASSRDAEQIDSYLTALGVTTFTSELIVNLEDGDLFFFLTRFYGPPTDLELDLAATIREFESRATNEESKRMIASSDDLRRVVKEFTTYFFWVVDDPNSPNIWRSLETTKERFLSSPVDHLLLLRRTDRLPPLSIPIFRQLGIEDERQVKELLVNYTDDEIETLVGPTDLSTREELIDFAADLITERWFELFTSRDASTCNNQEAVSSLEPFSEHEGLFLSRGSLLKGHDCFTLDELKLAWDANDHVSPVDPREHWSSDDLKEIRALLVDQELPEGFLTYLTEQIQLAKLREAGTRRRVEEIQASKENRELIRAVWITMFELGMYMRQWRGPGTPYPLLASETGRELRPGDDNELLLAKNVTESKNLLYSLIERLPMKVNSAISALPTVRFYNDTVEVSRKRTIEELYRATLIDTTECIRMASGLFTFTAAYYLKQTLGEEIPGYDLSRRIEYIQ